MYSTSCKKGEHHLEKVLVASESEDIKEGYCAVLKAVLVIRWVV